MPKKCVTQCRKILQKFCPSSKKRRLKGPCQMETSDWPTGLPFDWTFHQHSSFHKLAQLALPKSALEMDELFLDEHFEDFDDFGD